MRRAVITSGLLLAIVTLVANLAWAVTNRASSIVMTKNNNQGTGPGHLASECIGIISTETLPANKNDPVIWTITDGGHNAFDRCPSLDRSKVELHFDDMVMGASVLTSMGSVVKGTVSMAATPGSHKYRVFYKTLAAGPDPEIVVDCPSCGPPPSGGGPGNH